MPRGGQTAAVLYDITSTCQRLGVEPWAYLRDILTCLPTTASARLDDLLPDRWQTARAESPTVPSLRAEVQTYTVRVPVSRPEIITEQVPVTEMQPRSESYVVRLPETRTEIRTRRVPVTEYRTVTEEIVERVPVKKCIQVPYQIVVSQAVVGAP